MIKDLHPFFFKFHSTEFQSPSVRTLRYGQGYTLRVQLRDSDTQALRKFVADSFDKADLKEEHAGMCVWQLPEEVCIRRFGGKHMLLFVVSGDETTVCVFAAPRGGDCSSFCLCCFVFF
jgi:hypothetical protein